jgi:hypothetical protein
VEAEEEVSDFNAQRCSNAGGGKKVPFLMASLCTSSFAADGEAVFKKVACHFTFPNVGCGIHLQLAFLRFDASSRSMPPALN